MTTIEKPGNDELFAEHTYKEAYKPKRFECDVCECEFTATKGDYKKKWFSSLFSFYTKYKVVCPHCGTKLVTEAIPDSHSGASIDELLDELMEKLDNDVVEETEQEESTSEPIKQVQESGDNAVQVQTAIAYVPKSVTQVQKAGDNAVQVRVAGVKTKSPDTIFHEVLEEVKDKLGLDDVVTAQDITSEKPIKLLFQKGDRVVTVSKGLDDLIDDKEHRITSPVYADGKIVHYEDGSSDVDVVQDDDLWFRRNFGEDSYNSDMNVFYLTMRTLREMHEKESKKEKEKCRRST